MNANPVDVNRAIENLKDFRRGSKISTRLIFLIIAFSSLITLLITVVQLVNDYRGQRSGLDTTLEQIAHYVPNIAASVWNFDEQQITLTLETLVRLPNKIEQISVTTARQDQRWSAGNSTSRRVIIKTFPLHHQTGATEEIIGHLEVVASLDAIYRSVAAHAISILLSNGLKTFLVALFMLVMFRHLVTNRLEKLAHTVAALEPLVQASGASSTIGRLPDEGDEIDTLQQAFNDISRKLKLAIDELRSNQQQLQSILDNSTAVIFVNDLDGRLLLINRRFEELFHDKHKPLSGQTVYDFFPGNLAAALHAADLAVIQSGKVVESEHTVPQDDGLHTYISIKAPLFDESGKLYAICAIATDITERKKMEEELKEHRSHLEEMVKVRTGELAQANARQESEIAERKRMELALRSSEQFLNSIVENIPNMIFVKEAKELRFVRFNKAGEELIGHSRKDLVGKNDYDFFPAEEADFFTAKDRDVLGSKTLLDIPEETIQTSNQGRRILHTKKMPILDAEGNPQYLLGISEDITQRKQLEALVRQRNADVVAAKEQAEVANRAKSTFLTNISHELRTPLNAILGYAQILMKDNQLNERQKGGLHTIQRSGEHLLNMISDLLDLSRIEAGKLELAPNVFNLPVFLQTIGDIIRIKAEQKGLLFRLEAAADLPTTVQADEKRLRQILLNLLGNAVKYTDRGEVVLRVQILSSSTEQATVRIEVQDTGIGIHADQRETIFHPFEQVSEIQRRYGGTGLGLSISRQLAHLMDSEIHVDSRIGIGSRFWLELTLPLAAEAGALSASQSLSESHGSEDGRNAMPEGPLIAPPQPELKTLHALALTGNMRDIMQWIDHLESLDDNYRPFAEKLRQLCNSYQSKAILALVQQHLK